MLLIVCLLLCVQFIKSVKFFDPQHIHAKFQESERKLSWSSLNYRFPSRLDSVADMIIDIYTSGAYTVCTQELAGGPWKCKEPFHRINITPCNITMRSSSHTRYHRMTVIGITASGETIRTSIVDIYDK